MRMLDDARCEEKVLVAAEDASITAFPTHAGHYNDLVLVAQQGELPETFARRAIQRIEKLSSASWRPRVAIMALSAAVCEARFDARARIARALLSTLDGENPELVLVGHAGFSAAARHELFALVQTLSEAAPSVSICVNLSSPARGVRQARAAHIRTLHSLHSRAAFTSLSGAA